MQGEKFGRRDLLKRAAAGVGMGALGTALGASPRAQAQDAGDPAAKVPTRELGTTGQKIPILVFGCGQSLDKTYDRLLHRAFQNGIYYLDTAQQYDGGNSHKSVAAFQEQVGRKNVWITSKVPMGNTPEHYSRNLERMLPDLRTDYLDMFFMHGLNRLENLEPEFIQMADGLKKRGLIKFFGFSCHHGNVVELMNKAAKIGAPGIDAIMFRYSFASYGDLELNKAIDNCKKAGIGLIAMKTQRSIPESLEKVVEFQSKNWTLQQAKLKAAWADDRLDACIAEMTNTQQLSDNVAAAVSRTQLSMNEFMQLNRLAARTAHYACNGCSHICESRINADVRVAEMLRYLMYYDSYGKPELARSLFSQLKPHERNIEGVDFTQAMRACPQGINIAQRLRDAHALLA